MWSRNACTGIWTLINISLGQILTGSLFSEPMRLRLGLQAYALGIAYEFEVDFPVAEVSKHAARKKSIRHGHPIFVRGDSNKPEA